MNLIEFVWIRSPGAYSISMAPEIDGDPPVPWLSTRGEKYFETYRPTEFPALFQEFADMPATPEGMRDFFNTYGPVEWVDKRSPRKLRAVGKLSGSPWMEPGWFEQSTGVESLLAQHARLRDMINLFEAGNLSAVAQDVTRFGWGIIRPELRPGVDGRLRIVLVPHSLLDFLWLQFAQHVGSDAKLFRCEQCNRPFLVGTGTSRRSQAKYCSDACRHAAFRHRRGGAETRS
jgi:hypothetical protein